MLIVNASPTDPTLDMTSGVCLLPYCPEKTIPLQCYSSKIMIAGRPDAIIHIALCYTHATLQRTGRSERSPPRYGRRSASLFLSPALFTCTQPIGAVLSVSVVRDTFPGIKHISGVAADIVLRLPGIRSLYAWMGVRKAGRKSILDMFDDGVQVIRTESAIQH